MPNTPRRFASLLSSATEMLYTLGLGEQVVGVSHECDWPPAVADQPRLTVCRVDPSAPSEAIDRQVRALIERGEPLYEVDLPRLVELQPDVIVTQAQCDVCAVRNADVVAAVEGEPRLAGATIFSLNPQRLDDVLNEMESLARLAGWNDQRRGIVERGRSRVAAVRAQTAGLTPEQRPRVACIEWLEPLMIAANWMPELIDWAGGRQSLTQAGVHSGYTTWDEVVAFDPERIIIMPCGFDLRRTLSEAPLLARLPGWKQLSAVRRGEVIAVDGNAYFNRAGPRLVDSLEWLAHWIDPERFPSEHLGPGDDVFRRVNLAPESRVAS